MTPELVTDTSKSAPCSNGAKLSLSERTLLSFHEAYRYTCNTLSTALGISRISKVTISSSEPVCLLAKIYPDVASDSTDSNDDQDGMAAALTQFEQDLSERLWFSYRTGFSPLGEDQLTGDAGWGCTLRSCQMLLAQALLMHLLGRSNQGAAPERTSTRQHVVSCFHDSPDPCFSIHAICAAGAKYGLVPGRWMGPYALCRTVADIAANRCPDSLQVIVIESGGGAPCIDPDKLKRSFERPACDSAPPQGSPRGGDAPQGLLALVPVVLGVERLNSVYAQQLQAILRWPHSVGIVGGRPGHSYYFMGFQGDRLICMDPHVMQATDREPGALETHRPLGVQSVPIAAIDSTMALGFYCRSAADVDRLAESVQELADSCSRSPLLSLGSLPDVQDHDCDCSWDSEDDQAEAEQGVFVGSVPQVSADSGEDGAAHDEDTSPAVQAAPDRVHAAGDSPSSPVMVSGSLSSAELASTGVGGWEIVD